MRTIASSSAERAFRHTPRVYGLGTGGTLGPVARTGVWVLLFVALAGCGQGGTKAVAPDASSDGGVDRGDGAAPDLGDASDGAGCVACVRERFADPNNYRALKQQLRFQTQGAAYDY